MPIIVFTLAFLALNFSPEIHAKPNIYVEHSHTQAGYAKSRVKNNTIKDLACYMAIDGYKIKYVLPALSISRWFIATDKAFNHTHFSTWCGYLTLYPQYERYRVR